MVRSGLVAHWPLHEWSGRANDLSGENNHGTVNSTEQGVAGKSGLTTYSFDGSNSYVSQPRQMTTSEKSISVWVKLNTLSSTQGVLSAYDGTNGFRFRYNRFGHWQFITFDGNSNVYGNNQIEVGTRIDEWMHIVGIFTGNHYEFYVDGKLEDITEDSTFTDVQQAPPIGASDDQGTIADNFDGNISDVRIYNRALSPSEVKHLHRIGSVDVATPPDADDPSAVSRWSFDDRSDTSKAVDEWGTNSGAISGATYSADSIRDGHSMSFDGSNDEITGVSIPKTSEVTVSAWINPNNPTGFNQTIVELADNNDIELTLTGADRFVFGYDDSSSQFNASTNRVPPVGWQHIAGTIDIEANFVRIYENGSLIDEIPAGGSMVSSNSHATIGSNSGGRYFDGELDDVRIYSRALSDYEVQQLYLYGTRGVDRRYEVMRQ